MTACKKFAESGSSPVTIKAKDAYESRKISITASVNQFQATSVLEPLKNDLSSLVKIHGKLNKLKIVLADHLGEVSSTSTDLIKRRWQEMSTVQTIF